MFIKRFHKEIEKTVYKLGEDICTHVTDKRLEFRIYSGCLREQRKRNPIEK